MVNLKKTPKSCFGGVLRLRGVQEEDELGVGKLETTDRTAKIGDDYSYSYLVNPLNKCDFLCCTLNGFDMESALQELQAWWMLRLIPAPELMQMVLAASKEIDREFQNVRVDVTNRADGVGQAEHLVSTARGLFVSCLFFFLSAFLSPFLSLLRQCTPGEKRTQKIIHPKEIFQRT